MKNPSFSGGKAMQNEEKYYLDLNAPPLYCCSAMRKFGEGERHVTRTASYAVLILMFGGVLRFEENGEKRELRAGEYYIQRERLRQTGCMQSDTPEYFYIHFTGARYKTAREFLPDKTENSAIFTRPAESEPADENANANAYASEKLPLYGTFSANKIKPYIEKLTLLGFHASQTAYTGVFYEILSELNLPPVNAAEKIRRYIIENYQKKLLLDELCKTFYRSKNRLIEAFKKAYGTTPYAYHTEYRLMQAEQSLRATDLPLAAIAENSGYESYMLFYKAFLKRFRLSPSEYRKKYT